MTSTIELGKAQFWTIEAFQFGCEDFCFYEGERCEDLDTYWFEGMGGTLGAVSYTHLTLPTKA